MAIPPVDAKLSQFDYSWKVIEILWSILMAFLLWVGQRAIGRLDKLESKAVLQEDFDKALLEIRQERSRMHEENKEILARIESKIDVGLQATMQEKIRSLEERLERSVIYAEQLKHSHLDPCIRMVDRLQVAVDRLEKQNGN